MTGSISVALGPVKRAVNAVAVPWRRFNQLRRAYNEACNSYRTKASPEDALGDWHAFAAVPKAVVKECLSLKGAVQPRLEALLALERSPAASRLPQLKDRVDIPTEPETAATVLSHCTEVIAAQIRRHAESHLGNADTANLVSEAILAPAEAAADRLVWAGTNERLYSSEVLGLILAGIEAALRNKSVEESQAATVLEHEAVLEWLEGVDQSDKRKHALSARHRAESALQWASDGNDELASAIVNSSGAYLLSFAPMGDCSAEKLIEAKTDGFLADPVRAATGLDKAVATLSKQVRVAFGAAAKEIVSGRDKALGGVPKWSAEHVTAILTDAAPHGASVVAGQERFQRLPAYLAWMAASVQSKLRRQQEATNAFIAGVWTVKSEALHTEAQALEKDLNELKVWSDSVLVALANSIDRDLRALVDLVLEDLVNAWIETNQRDPLERSWDFRRRLVQMRSWNRRTLMLQGYGLDAVEHAAIGAAVKSVTADGRTAYEADVWLRLLEDGDPKPAGLDPNRIGERRW
jgi:hypothetical protein